MSGTPVDLATWDGADAFRFFRGFDRPHYAITARLDVSRLMAATPRPPVFRACLWALGAAVMAVPEMRIRFGGEDVVAHEGLTLSPTVARADGSFGYTYLRWMPDFTTFSRAAEAPIDAARAGETLDPNTDPMADIAYFSCLPWLDFTALDNALPGREDCIPRISWGRIVARPGGGHDMAVAMQVHHALVHGAHLGAAFAAAQAAFDRF